MSEPFLGEIRLVGFNFAPRGWAFCEGQILQINENQSLYSLLGTTYGGDGRTTFALPDLRGRIPFHRSDTLALGAKGGEEAHVLTEAEIPAHTHSVTASSNPANQPSPAGNHWPQGGGSLPYAANATGSMASQAISPTGQNQGHPNLPPVTVSNYIIALQGLFPPRN